MPRGNGPPTAGGQQPAASSEAVAWCANRRRADEWRDPAPGPDRTADPGRPDRGGGRCADLPVPLRAAAGPRLPVLRDRHVRDRRAAGRGGCGRAGGRGARRDRRDFGRSPAMAPGRLRSRPASAGAASGTPARSATPPGRRRRDGGPSRPGTDLAGHDAVRHRVLSGVRHRGPGLRRPGASAGATSGRRDPGAGRRHDRAGPAVRGRFRPLYRSPGGSSGPRSGPGPA